MTQNPGETGQEREVGDQLKEAGSPRSHTPRGPELILDHSTQGPSHPTPRRGSCHGGEAESAQPVLADIFRMTKGTSCSFNLAPLCSQPSRKGIQRPNWMTDRPYP